MSLKRPQQQKAKRPGLMGLPEAARFCTQELGIPTSAVTVWRHATHGFKGIWLHTVCWGARSFCTERDLREFMEKLAERRATMSERDNPTHCAPLPTDQELEAFAAAGE